MLSSQSHRNIVRPARAARSLTGVSLRASCSSALRPASGERSFISHPTVSSSLIHGPLSLGYQARHRQSSRRRLQCAPTWAWLRTPAVSDRNEYVVERSVGSGNFKSLLRRLHRHRPNCSTRLPSTSRQGDLGTRAVPPRIPGCRLQTTPAAFLNEASPG